MPLYNFLLVILSLACGSLPPSEQPLLSVLGSVCGRILGWTILCWLAARMTSNYVLNEECDSVTGARLLERQLDVFRWLGLGVIVLCLAGFGLARVLERIPVVADSAFLQALTLLAPGMMLLAVPWLAEHSSGVR